MIALTNDLVPVLAVLAGLGGVAAAGLAGPLTNDWRPDISVLKQRLFWVGSDQPTRWRRAVGITVLAGFLGGGAALTYAASPSAPTTAPGWPAPFATIAGPPRVLAVAKAAQPVAPPAPAPAPAEAPMAVPETVAMISTLPDSTPQRPSALDTARALDAAAVGYYYDRAVADNPLLGGPRVGLTPEEARRLTALEAVEADYWAAQPDWSRRSFASYDDAVGVLGKANADDLLALQGKWKSGRIATDLDQLAGLSPQDRQAEADRRGASLTAKLAQRAALDAASPQYATLSRDIADAQANLSDIKSRYGVTPRQP